MATKPKYIIVDLKTGRQLGAPHESYTDAVEIAKSASFSHPGVMLKIEEVF